MNIALNREATADKSREASHKTNGQFEALTLDTAFSEAVRELAEKSVDQTREAYDRAKDALEAAVDTMARSFDALGHGAAALNRKVIEIAQENVSSGFDLAKNLATARTLAEMVELRATYWRKQLSALSARRSPRVIYQGGSGHGRANQGACDAQHGTACRCEYCS